MAEGHTAFYTANGTVRRPGTARLAIDVLVRLRRIALHIKHKYTRRLCSGNVTLGIYNVVLDTADKSRRYGILYRIDCPIGYLISVVKIIETAVGYLYGNTLILHIQRNYSRKRLAGYGSIGRKSVFGGA